MTDDRPPGTHQWADGQVESIFETPPLPYRRRDAVRVVLPGQDDADERLDTDTITHLDGPITRLLDERTSVDGVEVLVFPNDTGGLEYVLSVPTPRTRPDDLGGSAPTTIGDFNDDDGDQPKWVDPLSTNLERDLPPTVGLEFGGLTFEDLGVSKMPASRLLMTKSRAVVGLDRLNYRPFVRTLEALVDAAAPFVLQVIISRGSGQAEYLMTVRLATYDPDTTITWNRDLHRHVKEGSPYDLADAYRHVGLESNFTFPIDDYYRVGGRRLILKRRNYHNWSETRAAREAVKGHAEYRDLFAARTGGDPVYEERDLIPRFPVRREELQLFGAIYPTYPAADVWDNAPGRGPPTWQTREVIAEAAGTDQAISVDGPDISLATTSMRTEGGREHQELGALAEAFLIERGYAIEQVTGSGSVPDIIARGHPVDLHVEAEQETETKPGHKIINAERAIEAGQGLFTYRTFATDDLWLNAAGALASTVWYAYERHGEPVDLAVVARRLAGRDAG